MIYQRLFFQFFVLYLFLFSAAFLFSGNAQAGVVDELKDKISNRADEIQKLETEIKGYKNQLEKIGEEKHTLQKEIKTIDITRQKLSSDIKVTENKIDASSFTIEKLDWEISEKERSISENMEFVSDSLRSIHKIESDSLVEMVLSSDNLSSFWSDIESLQSLQGKLGENIKRLAVLKADLEANKVEREAERENFIMYKSRLSDQKQIADNEKKKKDSILALTKNKESNYQTLLSEKLALKEAFEAEMRDLESQLKVAIDPNSLPPSGSGVLLWPLKEVFITQYFGNTEFARGGAYNGNGHNGIDLRASVGTPILSAASGIVEGTGNTDTVRGCYSYGKWVLVKHYNGLSTLYAHLSNINVIPGQKISAGSLLGYSGATGYSTGPHLHFTVYATQGVQIKKFENSINCKNTYIPIAPLNAYLNPLDYL